VLDSRVSADAIAGFMLKKCWLLVSEISMKLDVIIGVHHGDVVVSTVK
jgi:hypothetical protein